MTHCIKSDVSKVLTGIDRSLIASIFRTVPFPIILLNHSLDHVLVCVLQVGGEFTDTVMEHHMKQYGRVVVVGGISVYNEKEPPKGKHQSVTDP